MDSGLIVQDVAGRASYERMYQSTAQETIREAVRETLQEAVLELRTGESADHRTKL